MRHGQTNRGVVFPVGRQILAALRAAGAAGACSRRICEAREDFEGQ
jgi:hypothetical protein